MICEQDLNPTFPKIHRRYKPQFAVEMINHPIAKRLDAILNKHSWTRNRYMSKLRENGATLIKKKVERGQDIIKIIPPRRATIRLEREETLNALVRAMIYRTDYDPDAPYLFEVKASVPLLAEMIGQLHNYDPKYDGENGQYRNGRVAYDPVLGALEDLAAAKLILLVHEFDKKAKQHKAMRIFLRPELFKSFGLTMNDTKKLISNSRKWMTKNGLLLNNKDKRKKELIRQCASDRIAGLDRPSLKNLLARLRREFLGENDRAKQIVDSHKRVKDAIKKSHQKYKTVERSELEVSYIKLCSQLPPIRVHQLKKEIEKQYSNLSDNERLKLLVEALKGYT